MVAENAVVKNNSIHKVLSDANQQANPKCVSELLNAHKTE
jgi:hypothetical protein